MRVTGSLEEGHEPLTPKENNKMPAIPAILAQPGQPGKTTSKLRFDIFKKSAAPGGSTGSSPPSPH
jgi:hypothetical protein